ncbi:MAG TPA: hypothetical protein VEY91_02100 [Candidatus Limnocylindria bacterium]|nr:hypothetical protein [Candidatus Limnocylindria bacterium]
MLRSASPVRETHELETKGRAIPCPKTGVREPMAGAGALGSPPVGLIELPPEGGFPVN